MRKSAWIAFFFILLLSLKIGFAQQSGGATNLTTGFYKAYPLGMGGAWRSLAEGTNSITINPAGMTFKKATALSFDYCSSGFLDSRILSGSLYDSRSIGVAGGFTFDRNDMTIDGRESHVNQFVLALAKGYSNVASFGLNFKYIQIRREIVSGGDLDVFTGDLGVMVKPIKQLSFATVLQNIYTGSSHQEVPLLLGFGSALILGNSAKLSVETETDFSTKNGSKTNYYFGGEVLLTQGVYFRSGFGLDRVRDNPFFGTGLGFYGPKFSLDFTFSERLNPVEQTYALSVQLSM